MSITWLIFETAGTIAFALSGSLVALSRRMDIFGVAVLAALTAVGGGMIRDVLIGAVPPHALADPVWLLLALAVAAAACAVFSFVRLSRKSRRVFAFFYNLSDTVGLAAFSVTGAAAGFYSSPQSRFVLPVMLGLLTGVGGGVLRDLLAQRVPVVLKADVYALASIGGTLAACAARPFLSGGQTAWLGFAVVALLRTCALAFGWQLYHPRPRAAKKSPVERKRPKG